jgi:hypothetical protein
MEKFLTLRDVFGGSSLWIPKSGRLLTCGTCGVRNRCIYRWHEQGHSPTAISAVLKMKPRTVVRIIRTQTGAPAA